MVDTHCHLNFHSFKKDYAIVARAAGVTKIINVGAKLDSSRRAVKIANEIPFCFAAVGVHPHHAEDFPDLNVVRDELSKLIEDYKKDQGKIVAVGECGLDYHEYFVGGDLPVAPHADRPGGLSLREKQKELFFLHVKLAKKYSLPLIIHCRDAYSDLLSLLRTTNYPPAMPAHSAGGRGVLRTGAVIHCFQGSLDDLKQFLSLGFYIGYDGYITYEEKNQNVNLKMKNDNAKCKIDGNKSDKKKESKIKFNHYEELVKNTPLGRILTETDSPWLTPEPLRGKRNTPANIKIICEKIAEIKKVPFEEIDQITTENAKKLFRI